MQTPPIPAGLAKSALLQDREGEMASRVTEKQDGQGSSDFASRNTADQASDFAPILFARTDPEDLALLDLETRAEIARSARAVLSASRPRGEALVTLRDIKIGPGVAPRLDNC